MGEVLTDPIHPWRCLRGGTRQLLVQLSQKASSSTLLLFPSPHRLHQCQQLFIHLRFAREPVLN